MEVGQGPNWGLAPKGGGETSYEICVGRSGSVADFHLRVTSVFPMLIIILLLLHTQL
jgi:hypothetical protein